MCALMCSECTNVHAEYFGWIVFFFTSEFNDSVNYNLWLFMEVWVTLISDLRPRKSKCKQVKCINCDLQRMSELAVVSFVACDGLRGRGATWKRGELRKNPLSYIISGSVGGWY